MAGETIITVVGNLTADPELRYTQGGLAVANAGDGHRWRALAEDDEPATGLVHAAEVGIGGDEHPKRRVEHRVDGKRSLGETQR